MTDNFPDIPRWAEELGPEVWQQINEMLDGGHKTMDIVRELSIPRSKLRSLQTHVQRHGPRRRLVQFARFKDALLAQAEQFGADLVEALGVVAKRAVSNETKAVVQVRAFEAMTTLVGAIQKMIADDAKEEDKRRIEEGAGPKVDANAMVARILERYGVSDGHE